MQATETRSDNMFDVQVDAKKIFRIGGAGEDNLPHAPLLVLSEAETKILLSNLCKRNGKFTNNGLRREWQEEL